MPKQKEPSLAQFFQFTGLKTRPWINLDTIWKIQRFPRDYAHPKNDGYTLYFTHDEEPLKITETFDVTQIAKLLGDDPPDAKS